MVTLGSRSWTVSLAAAALALTPLAARAEVGAPRPFGAVSCPADPAAGGAAGRGARIVAVKTPPTMAPSAARSGRFRPAAQVTRNDRADVTFELRPAAGGGVEVSARSGDLQVTKTVQENGEFVLTLTTPRDAITISVSGQGTGVTRGRTSIVLPRTAASPEAKDRIRRLMAESRAVVRFREVAAALINAEDRSPASLAVIMADATVGLLAGDPGAPRRIAEYLAHGRSANARPAGLAVDCFAVMETRMVEAWGDYWS
jgi:hypothetical protein